MYIYIIDLVLDLHVLLKLHSGGEIGVGTQAWVSNSTLDNSCGASELKCAGSMRPVTSQQALW